MSPLCNGVRHHPKEADRRQHQRQESKTTDEHSCHPLRSEGVIELPGERFHIINRQVPVKLSNCLLHGGNHLLRFSLCSQMQRHLSAVTLRERKEECCRHWSEWFVTRC